MNRPIVFLQNSYSPVYAGREWPRESWLRALAACRSGKMLTHLGQPWGVMHNTTPQVGRTASSKLPPDYDHMLRVIQECSPASIVACGQQAIDAVRLIWDGPRVELPHPACRWVKSTLYQEGKRLLDLQVRGGMNFRARVWEKKGEPFKVEILRQEVKV
jgi:hypothetical protein